RALVLDACAHARDLRSLVVRQAAAVDEAGDDLLQTSGEGAGTRDDAGPDERLALPELRTRRVVGRERVERRDERALAAGRPEAGVDPVRDPLARRRLERADGALRDAGEDVVRQRTSAPPPRVPRFVDEDEVEIRGVGELAAAELPHGDDGEAVRRRGVGDAHAVDALPAREREAGVAARPDG